MPTVNISPVWNGTQFLTETGKPLVGGKIYTYESGSFTAQKTTYSNNTGTAENPNPIVLDTTGRMPTDIWLVPGEYYNLVLKTPDDETIKNVDNVGVSRIVAGDNIEIDPATGIGAVTITGIWPKFITNTFGHGRSYMYWLYSTDNMLFDNSNYTAWNGILKSPLAQANPDVMWDETNKVFLFQTAGSYTVSITMKLDPSDNEVVYWPEGATVFGVSLSGAGNQVKTYNTRYSDVSGSGLGSENQITTWSEDLTVSVQANDEIELSAYAYSPDHPNRVLIVSASVIITRFGNPYELPS